VKALAIAALIAAPAAADVMHEPGGWALCDYRPEAWWAAQPSILGGPTQPMAATHPTLWDPATPAEWAFGAVTSGGGERPVLRPAPPPVVSEPPAPVPIGGIGALFAGLLAGVGIAVRVLR
jgi:hypothetical protein